MSVRVRFAPSPTGYLHVGGLRTALYNYLFARHHKGQFILRIEDTDRARIVEKAVENLIKSLRWAGIEYDEGPDVGGQYGPYIQSERLGIYNEHAKKLVESGNAYYAFDTPEEIEEMRQRLAAEKRDPKYDRMNMRNELSLLATEVKSYLDKNFPYVVRLKVPDGIVKFKDLIRGEVSVDCKDIDDQVLLKSDGFPTYHLANVVDDYLMKITHVIRGEEWLPSTPKHILLYEAFGWNKPQFAHLPLLLNPDKTKLSKRQGDVAVEDYRDKGYIRDAFINFIALLGWNPTGDRELYSIEELIEYFNLEKVNKGGAVFDIKKLDWMNQQYLKKSPLPLLVDKLQAALSKSGLLKFKSEKEYLGKIIELMRERVTFIQDIPVVSSYFFAPPSEYESQYMEKHWKEGTSQLVSEYIEALRNETGFSHDSLHHFTISFAEGKGQKLKDIIHPLRLMITGKSAGAGMFETMEVLGKEECISRIENFLKFKAGSSLITINREEDINKRYNVCIYAKSDSNCKSESDFIN